MPLTPTHTEAPVRLSVRLAETPSLIGREFRGPWFVIDQNLLPLYDRSCGIDDETSTMDPDSYPDKLVEGFHLLGFLDPLLNDVVTVDGDPWYGLNYGLDRVRFVTPVLAGQPIRLRGRIGDVREKGDGYLVLHECVVEIEGEERPGFLADFWALWRPAANGTVHVNSEGR
ncbi:hypothetical protein ACFTWF_40950 [Rhodococcus sp. NPDC056960]|uniref:hypothetical protein n=1 Tax=Rhodococcus sp. NPDC056960 TaxID=3345982 RepID=UPI00362DA9F9